MAEQRTIEQRLVRWWFALRYRWACLSGRVRRMLGLSFRNGRTISEVMYELEKDPVLRELLNEERRRVRK